jgi:hypothetical protein
MTLDEEKMIVRRLNRLALDYVLYAPLGVMLHRRQVSLYLAPLAIGDRLLDLEGGHGLGFPDPLASKIGTVPALLLGELHGRGGAAADGGLLNGGIDLAIRRSMSVTMPASTWILASTSAARRVRSADRHPVRRIW